jgi:hypothetical protein
MYTKNIYSSEYDIVALSESTNNREISVHTRPKFRYVNFMQGFIRGLINADYPPCLGKLSINLRSIPLFPASYRRSNSKPQSKFLLLLPVRAVAVTV